MPLVKTVFKKITSVFRPRPLWERVGVRGGLLVFCVLSVVALLACGTPVSGPSGTQDDNYEFDGSPFKGDGMTGKHEGSSGDGDAGDGDGGGDGDSPGDGDGGSSGGGSGSGGGGGDVGPVSLPAPTLKKTLVAAADKEGNVPAVGYPGAVDTKDENYDPDAEYQVIMTPKESTKLEARNSKQILNTKFKTQKQNTNSRVYNLLFSNLKFVSDFGFGISDFIFKNFRTAIAESPPPNTCSETLADSLDMNLDDAACCDVKKDGSFTCYYKDKEAEAVDYAKLESQEYCLYLTDGKDMIPFSEGCEKPNTNALWLAQKSVDITKYEKNLLRGYKGFRVLSNITRRSDADPTLDTGTNIIGIHSTMPSPLEGEGERLRVSGMPTNFYQEMVVSASELAFSKEGFTNSFAMRRIINPVEVTQVTCNLDPAGVWDQCQAPLDFAKGDEQLEKYLKLKTTRDGQIWFSGKYKKQDETKAYVYNLKDGALEDSYIPITVNDQLDNNKITVSEILNFDVDENGFALAVFRDDKGNLKVRVGHEYAPWRYGLMPLENINFVNDVSIYKVKNEISSDLLPKKVHHAILLDGNSGKLYKIFATQLENKISLEGSVIVGKNSTEMALNSGNNKVFVINSGDATITVVPLLNDTAEVLTVEQMEAQKKTFNLKELFAGKSIPFKPEQIVYDDLGTTDNLDDRLIIGDKGLRSVVVLPTTYAINGMPKKLTPLIGEDLLLFPLKFPSPLVGEGLDPIKKIDFQKLFP